jgi:hypothetical protein
MTLSTLLDPFTFGPRIWTRYLLRRFQCELDALNCQLTKKIKPGEVFQFGIEPEPLPRRTVEKLFDRPHNLGSNPDGRYVKEPYSEEKFNLFERVVERIPASKYWLLQDWTHYFETACPHIDISIEIFTRLTEEMDICLVDSSAFQAWTEADPKGFEQAEAITTSSLVHCHVPEIISLLLSMLHVAAWKNIGGRYYDKVIWSLHSMLYLAVRTFSKSPAFDYSDDSWEIATQIPYLVQTAPQNIARSGARSEPKKRWDVPDFPDKIIFVRRSDANAKAMRTLHAGGDQWCDGSILELLFPDAKFPTSQELAEAAALLLQAVEDMQLHLKERAEANLAVVETEQLQRA